MPTYEYACASCGNTWEDVQKISEPALTTCPKCKNETAKRQISGGSFILKGGGWYADAYSSKPKSASSDSGGGGDKPSSDAKSETKSEAKSEAKSESKTETKKESTAPAAPAAAPAKKD
jgi:putative FmdB family regulatory protein